MNSENLLTARQLRMAAVCVMLVGRRRAATQQTKRSGEAHFLCFVPAEACRGVRWQFGGVGPTEKGLRRFFYRLYTTYGSSSNSRPGFARRDAMARRITCQHCQIKVSGASCPQCGRAVKRRPADEGLVVGADGRRGDEADIGMNADAMTQ